MPAGEKGDRTVAKVVDGVPTFPEVCGASGGTTCGVCDDYPCSPEQEVEEMVEREGGRDAELIERVEARVQAAKDEVRTSAIQPMNLGERAAAAAAVMYPEVCGMPGGTTCSVCGEFPCSPDQVEEEEEKRVGTIYLPRELCEERSVIEGFLEDGGLTEREEDLAALWLRWDDVAQNKGAMPGTTGCVVGPEEAEGLRSQVYRDLAFSYSQAVGEPGSKVRSGADEGPRFGGLDEMITTGKARAPGGLVLSKESVRGRGAEEGGALGPGDLMAWLEEFVEMRGSDIAGELSRMGAYEETLRSEWVSLRRRKAVLEGQQLVVGALVRAIEERGG